MSYEDFQMPPEAKKGAGAAAAANTKGAANNKQRSKR